MDGPLPSTKMLNVKACYDNYSSNAVGSLDLGAEQLWPGELDQKQSITCVEVGDVLLLPLPRAELIAQSLLQSLYELICVAQAWKASAWQAKEQ